MKKALVLAAALLSMPALGLCHDVPIRDQEMDRALEFSEPKYDMVDAEPPTFSSTPAELRRDIESSQYDRDEAAEYYSGRRELEMDMTMRTLALELTLGGFLTGGRQQFEVISSSTGALISRLKYKNEGFVPLAKAELKLGRISIGGKYGGSTLFKRTCTDEDWNLPWLGDYEEDGTADQPTDYQITTQRCKSKIEFWDANLYYNLLDSRREGSENYRFMLVDDISLDAFAGYQYYRGRYIMTDPTSEWLVQSEGDWYYSLLCPFDQGLDSLYTIRYQGPRAGVRLKGYRGRISASFSLAAAYLKTKAWAYWNLRDYPFWQSGQGGIGVDADMEFLYALTRSWSAGLGVTCIGLYQHKMKESGISSGVPYSDEDIVRDANSTTCGLTMLLKYTF